MVPIPSQETMVADGMFCVCATQYGTSSSSHPSTSGLCSDSGLGRFSVGIPMRSMPAFMPGAGRVSIAWAFAACTAAKANWCVGSIPPPTCMA